MKRWLAIALLVLCCAWGGSVYAQGVPAYKGQVVQDEAGALTAAQTVELTATLSALSPEAYRVLIVKDAGGADMTDYLDQVWTDWTLPGHTILVVIFADSGNIRINLGSELHRYGLTGEMLVQAAREVFSPLARDGKLADGMGALAQDLNKRVLAGGGVAAPSRPTTDPAPKPPADSTPEQPAKEPEVAAPPAPQAAPAAAPKSGTAATWRNMSVVTFTAAGLLAVFLLMTGRRNRRRRVRRM